MGRKRKYFTLKRKKLIKKFASYCFYYIFALANRNKRTANMLSISTEKMDQQNAPPSAEAIGQQHAPRLPLLANIVEF